MFQISQCVTSILELFISTGSGSCISSTKLCVPIGTCDHLSSGDGDIGPAACVYLSGMTPPSSKAVVVISSGGGRGGPPGGAPPAGGWPCAKTCPDQTPRKSTAANAVVECSTYLFIVFALPQLQTGRTIRRQDLRTRIQIARTLPHSVEMVHLPQLHVRPR